MKKISKKKALILSVLCFFFIVGVGSSYYYYFHIHIPHLEYLADREIRSVSVIDSFTGESLKEIEINNLSTVTVHDLNEISEEIEITSETVEIQLESPLVTSNQRLFHYWDITKSGDQDYIIKPVFEDVKDFIITFNSSPNTNFTMNSVTINSIKRSAEPGTNIYDLLPDVEVNQYYWYYWAYRDHEDTLIPLPEVDDKNINDFLTSDLTIEIVEFEDKNSNQIDDATEEFTVTYVTNAQMQIDEKVVKYGENLELPFVYENDTIFIDWFTDPDFKNENKVTEKTVVTDDIIVYAKLVKFEDFINESVENPIVRQDLALQVEDIITSKNNMIDVDYNDYINDKIENEKEMREYSRENNIISTDGQINKYNFHNRNHNKNHVVTFLDDDGSYKFALVAPYGQTIRIVNNNNELSREFMVRHHTTINLSSATYSTGYYRINQTVFIKVTEN